MRAIAQRPTDTKNRNCWHALLEPDTGGGATLLAVFFDIPYLHQSAEVNARMFVEEYNLRLRMDAPVTYRGDARAGAWRDSVRTGA